MGGTFDSDLDPVDDLDSEEDLDEQRRAGRVDAAMGNDEARTSVFRSREQNAAREEGFDAERTDDDP